MTLKVKGRVGPCSACQGADVSGNSVGDRLYVKLMYFLQNNVFRSSQWRLASPKVQRENTTGRIIGLSAHQKNQLLFRGAQSRKTPVGAQQSFWKPAAIFRCCFRTNITHTHSNCMAVCVCVYTYCKSEIKTCLM